MPSDPDEPQFDSGYEQWRTVAANTDEGMLREAHDLLAFGVKQWRSSTFAWVASDLIERLAARCPEPADVIEDDDG